MTFWERDSGTEGNLCLIFQFGDDVCESAPLTPLQIFFSETFFLSPVHTDVNLLMWDVVQLV